MDHLQLFHRTSQHFTKVMQHNHIKHISPQNHTSLEQVKSNRLQIEYEIVQQYLNIDFPINNQSSHAEEIFFQKTQNIAKGPLALLPSVVNIPPPAKRQKSALHNFQKHLITVIKKFVNLSQKKLSLHPYGQISYAIWQAFYQSSFVNKKTLNLVFGSSDLCYLSSQIQSSKQFHAFKRIFSKHPFSDIQQAQKLLRETVVTQTRSLSKNFFKSHSKVAKFQELYEYFQGFLAQIENGPLSRRLFKLPTRNSSADMLDQE